MSIAAGLALLISLAACLPPTAAAPTAAAPTAAAPTAAAPRESPTPSPDEGSDQPVVAPTALEQMRISGEKLITPDNATKTQIAAARISKIITSYKLCIGEDGVPTQMQALKTSGFPAYDAKIQSEMFKWRYRPYTLDGVPKPVCTSVTFVYQQKNGGKSPTDFIFTAAHPRIAMISPGSGPAAPLRLTPALDSKQRVAMTYARKGIMIFPRSGPTPFNDALMMTGTSSVTEIDNGEISYVTRVEHSEREAGSRFDALVGTVIDGAMSLTGAPGRTIFRFGSGGWAGEEILGQSYMLLVTWMILPAEPIAVGAQWEVSMTETIAEVEVTVVTRYTLVGRTASTSTLVGEIKVSGADQNLGKVKLRSIRGSGKIEVLLMQGRLYPKLKRVLHLELTAQRDDGEAPVSLDVTHAFEPQWPQASQRPAAR